MNIKEVWNICKVKLIEGLKVATKAFLEALWNYIKEDVILSARKSLQLLAELVKSDAGQAKKAYIVDIVLQKIALPVFLRPFKGLIRKFLADKIEEAVIALINKGKEIIG